MFTELFYAIIPTLFPAFVDLPSQYHITFLMCFNLVYKCDLSTLHN